MMTTRREDRVEAIVHSQDGATVVRLTRAEYGSLDMEKLVRLRRLLLDLAGQPAPPQLVVDLSRVHFFGARFIGVLVDTWHQLQKQNRRLVLSGMMPYCARLIRILHLEKLFDAYPTRRAALNRQQIDGEGEVVPTGLVRVEVSEVAWNPNMVRLEYLGDDGS